ncbi:hypothetical protein SRHO_G00323820 [Serrasalmus rhombeus]
MEAPDRAPTDKGQVTGEPEAMSSPPPRQANIPSMSRACGPRGPRRPRPADPRQEPPHAREAQTTPRTQPPREQGRDDAKMSSHAPRDPQDTHTPGGGGGVGKQRGAVGRGNSCPPPCTTDVQAQQVMDPGPAVHTHMLTRHIEALKSYGPQMHLEQLQASCCHGGCGLRSLGQVIRA